MRVEVGPRDLAEGSVTVARRIAGGKSSVPLGGRGRHRDAARSTRTTTRCMPPRWPTGTRNTAAVATVEEAAEAAATGWATIPWSTLGPEGEALLAESAVTVRCLTMPDGSVPASESDDGVLAVVGRAY